MRRFKVSERRACRVVGQHRSSNRYAAAPVDFEVKLVARMTALAEQHPRWGYRMVHGLLVEEGWAVNKKRIERLWRQEGLQVPPQRLKPSGGRAIGESGNSAANLPALYRNHVWTYDFMSARTVDGGALRILNVLDEHTREALGSKVARSIGSESVRQHLAKLFAIHGKPKFIRADNGREFIADRLLDWLGEQQIRGVFIAKASPQQNSYMERFNGTMERELFGHEVYHSVLEVQYVVDEWLEKYNTRRSHRSLGGKTPAAYAKMALTRADFEMGGGSE